MHEKTSNIRSYGCLTLVDIFQFNNVYALTPDIEDFVASPDLQSECVRYVSTGMPFLQIMILIIAGDSREPSFATIFELYCSLRQGKTLRQWIPEHKSALGGIDIRRFISFGVIKGFIYRVHRYPVLLETSSSDKKSNEKRKPFLKYV